MTSESTSNGGDFECNICLELAQDPIVTLCGHLYCWPCLYKWLNFHSQSHDCPVCKSCIQLTQLVPLYGRGKINNTDPRSRPLSGHDNIPNRPSGQRPETAVPPPPVGGQSPYFSNLGFGFLGGFMPMMTTARFGNMTMPAGLFPSLMSFQFNGGSGSGVYGHGHGHGFPYAQTVNGGFHQPRHTVSQGQDSLLKNILLFVGFLVILTFIWS